MDENIGAFFLPRVDGFEIIALGKLGVSGATVPQVCVNLKLTKRKLLIL